MKRTFLMKSGVGQFLTNVVQVTESWMPCEPERTEPLRLANVTHISARPMKLWAPKFEPTLHMTLNGRSTFSAPFFSLIERPFQFFQLLIADNDIVHLQLINLDGGKTPVPDIEVEVRYEDAGECPPPPFP